MTCRYDEHSERFTECDGHHVCLCPTIHEERQMQSSVVSLREWQRVHAEATGIAPEWATRAAFTLRSVAKDLLDSAERIDKHQMSESQVCDKLRELREAATIMAQVSELACGLASSSPVARAFASLADRLMRTPNDALRCYELAQILRREASK